MNRGSRGSDAAVGRARDRSQVLGNTFTGPDGRPNLRPTRRESFDNSQVLRFDRGRSNDSSSQSARTEGNRRRDSAVGRAGWAEILGNTQAGRGAERRANAGRGRGGDGDAATVANQPGRRGEGRFGENRIASGRVTNDQVRDFLSLRNRGDGERGNRTRVDGERGGDEGSSSRRTFATQRREAFTGGEGPGARGDGDGRGRNRSGDDGARRDGIGRESGRRDGIAGDVRARRGEGRGGNWGDDRRGGDRGDRVGRDIDPNWRDADGKFRRWRGGELGRGDHRDRSGRWRDGKRFDVAHRIRDDWRGRDWRGRRDIPFHGDWWRGSGRRHHHHHNHWGLGGWWGNWGWYGVRFHQPYYWWNWCSAPRLRTWFVYDWATPYYWDYGQGEYIHCYNNVIYVNGQWFEPAPVYYERTIVLAESAPEIAPEAAAQVEWLPLGVFAVSRDSVVDHNLLVQLAVTKDGVIGGTVLNQATGENFDISGNVDKNSQRAAWTYVDETGRKVAMETSVFNLTQPESTALLHNGPEDMQVVQLVRLEEPDADAAGVGAVAPVANGAAPPAAEGVRVAKPEAELPPPADVPDAEAGDASAPAALPPTELPPGVEADQSPGSGPTVVPPAPAPAIPE